MFVPDFLTKPVKTFMVTPCFHAFGHGVFSAAARTELYRASRQGGVKKEAWGRTPVQRSAQNEAIFSVRLGSCLCHELCWDPQNTAVILTHR